MTTLYDVSKYQWTMRILALDTEHISLGAKVTLCFLPSTLEKFGMLEENLLEDHIRIAQGYLAKVMGIEQKAIGRHLAELVELELITVKRERIWYSLTPHVSCFYAMTEDALNGILRKSRQRHRGNGQKNEICRHCGSTDTFVQAKRRVICRDCGVVEEGDWQTVKDIPGGKPGYQNPYRKREWDEMMAERQAQAEMEEEEDEA